MQINANTPMEFVKVSFVEDIRFSKWQGIDIVMDLYKEVETLRTRLFRPKDQKSRLQVHQQLKHILCTLSGDCTIYDKIPYCDDWMEFVTKYRKLCEPYVGTKLYGKVLNKGDDVKPLFSLGFETPFLSHNKDLVYGDIEELYIDWEDSYDTPTNTAPVSDDPPSKLI